MDNREIALILFNLQLDMDYADAKPYGKMEVNMLGKDIAMLRKEDSPLFYVLENIAMLNDDVTILIDGTEED